MATDAAALPADELAAALVAALTGEARDLVAERPVYIALRDAGRRVLEGWIDGPELGERLRAIGREPGLDADLLEIAFTHDYRTVEPGALQRQLPHRDRGVRGVRIMLGCVEERLAPSRMIADNLGFDRAAERFCGRLGVVPAEFSRRGGRLESFGARTLLVPLDGQPPMEPFRAGLLVPASAVTAELVEETARGMAAWLVRNTDAEGRLPYKYWPSRNAYSEANNTIRQFMATVCLGRIAAHWDDEEAADAARRNLAYNLRTFFERRGDVGMISYDGSAKLGATALAGLAILEQEGLEGPHGEILTTLIRGTESLWEPDGSFRTFHYPPERGNDNQNFYPGEALLFWASLWLRTREEGLLERILASFRYYRTWHRAQPNPAFVPWHTQAYALVHSAHPAPELLAFIFEMNDWLLPMQQGAEAGHPDLIGRFYDPERPDFGPPHASSTGVYLEGLADAAALALATGDEPRVRAYSRAITAGVRNLRQLQFKDEADLFYVTRPERILGALRTNPYDNTIRIDNVQHGLMALLKLVGGRQEAAGLGRG